MRVDAMLYPDLTNQPDAHLTRARSALKSEDRLKSGDGLKSEDALKAEDGLDAEG